MTSVYFSNNIRFLLFFLQPTSLPSAINPVLISPVEEKGDKVDSGSEDESVLRFDHPEIAQQYIYEVDLVAEYCYIYKEAFNIHFFPTGSNVFNVQTKNGHESLVKEKHEKEQTHNLLLICNEVFSKFFGEEFESISIMYIVTKNKLQVVLPTRYGEKLYNNEIRVQFHMGQCQSLLFRLQIFVCKDNDCNSVYHFMNDKDHPIRTSDCLCFEKISFDTIERINNDFRATFSNTNKGFHTHALMYQEKTFKVYSIANNTIKFETVTFQESMVPHESIGHTELVPTTHKYPITIECINGNLNLSQEVVMTTSKTAGQHSFRGNFVICYDITIVRPIGYENKIVYVVNDGKTIIAIELNFDKEQLNRSTTFYKNEAVDRFDKYTNLFIHPQNIDKIENNKIFVSL